MASLNTSTNGASITRSYQSIVDAPPPSGSSASSPTYGQWAVYSVQAPLANAFQPDAGKESVLKVQSTGEGELVDLIDEFSDGRIQFGFVKIKDPNTTLGKSVLIAWCGEGVPERTKGYFTSHLSAVSKLLHGYHVQVTARSDSDLTPDGIIKKVADSSGSKYSGDSTPAPSAASRGPPPVASKPVFTPSRVGGVSSNFKPLEARSRQAQTKATDDDGWGDDAPQVTRTQLERVQPAYQRTQVDMGKLQSQKQESRFQAPTQQDNPDVVKGIYQPIGKVDIAAIRKQAAQSGSSQDDRPAPVKGSYEPVGKVDIASIRARAQPPTGGVTSPPSAISPAQTGASARSNQSSEEPKSLTDRSAAFSSDAGGRLTSLPKPKVANKFGGGAGTFTGTKAPAPGGLDASKPTAPAAPVGTASRTFADEGGKTPAQIWAEKKARERGDGGAADTATSTAPIASQSSGSGWESGYAGKKWGAVQTTRTGASGTSAVNQQRTGEESTHEDPASPSTNVSSIRDKFKNVAPMGTTQGEDQVAPTPPPMDLSSKPSSGPPRGVSMPGLPTRQEQVPAEDHRDMPEPPMQPPRSPSPPTPEMRPSSPFRIAQPVARTEEKAMEAPEERFSLPPMPTQSISEAVPKARDIDEEPQVEGHDPARIAGVGAANSTFGSGTVSAAEPRADMGGKRARAEYDYEAAEENELSFAENEIISNIDMVDEDWWMGENERGEKGLFPQNYVVVMEEEHAAPSGATAPAQPARPPAAEPAAKAGPTATAEYDYEASEENELSFPENATITDIEFPDEDWWFGHYGGKSGLFPANYVKLDE